MYKRLTKIENGEITGEFTFREALERLAELEDKIESRTLIELPCKDGDIVYVVEGSPWYDIEEKEVCAFGVDRTDVYLYDINGDVINDDDYQYQRYVFFTKEEAEAKLKELEEEK